MARKTSRGARRVAREAYAGAGRLERDVRREGRRTVTTVKKHARRSRRGFWHSVSKHFRGLGGKPMSKKQKEALLRKRERKYEAEQIIKENQIHGEKVKAVELRALKEQQFIVERDLQKKEASDERELEMIKQQTKEDKLNHKSFVQQHKDQQRQKKTEKKMQNLDMKEAKTKLKISDLDRKIREAQLKTLAAQKASETMRSLREAATIQSPLPPPSPPPSPPQPPPPTRTVMIRHVGQPTAPPEPVENN